MQIRPDRTGRWHILAALGVLLLVSAATPATVRIGMEPAAVSADQDTSSYVAVPEADQPTRRYHRTGLVAWGLQWTLALLVPIGIAVVGVLPRIQRVMGRRHWSLQTVVLASLYTAITLTVTFPLALYDEHLRARAVGLTEQSIPAWAYEWGLRAAMITLLAAAVSPLAYLLIRRRARSWWLWGGLTGGALGFLLAMVFPVWIEPLLDRFHPMPDSSLRTEILDIAERAGVRSPSLYIVEKRGETEMVNAYVTGFGGTKRIVFWDTLLDLLDPPELRFTAAHELAHDVLDHNWWLLAVGATLLTAGLWAVRHLALRLDRWMPGPTASRLDDPTRLPVLVLAGTVVAFFLLPILGAATRYVEREADRFALELTRDNRAAATTFIALQERNQNHPNPGVLHRVFRATHPSTAERVRFANRYRPWESGEDGVYGEHLR